MTKNFEKDFPSLKENKMKMPCPSRFRHINDIQEYCLDKQKVRKIIDELWAESVAEYIFDLKKELGL